jgi:hypothetical protein
MFSHEGYGCMGYLDICLLAVIHQSGKSAREAQNRLSFTGGLLKNKEAPMNLRTSDEYHFPPIVKICRDWKLFPRGSKGPHRGSFAEDPQKVIGSMLLVEAVACIAEAPPNLMRRASIIFIRFKKEKHSDVLCH